MFRAGVLLFVSLLVVCNGSVGFNEIPTAYSESEDCKCRAEFQLLFERLRGELRRMSFGGHERHVDDSYGENVDTVLARKAVGRTASANSRTASRRHHRHQKLAVNDVCPHGFTYLPEAKGCYQVVYESLDWTSAARRCQQFHKDAHLATLTTRDKNDAVKSFLQSDYSRNSVYVENCLNTPSNPSSRKGIWTALRKQTDSCEAPFVWKPSDDVQLPLNYTDWDTLYKQPDCWHDNEFCVHFQAFDRWQWNDFSCGGASCALCEYNIL